MSDGERLATFLDRYASRLEGWVDLLSNAGTADIGSPEDPLARVLDELLEDLDSLADGAPPLLTQLRNAISEGLANPRALAEAALDADPGSLEQLADRTGLSPAACRAVGNLLARPMLRAGQVDAPVLPGGAAGLECPVCGRFASMGFLLPENGKRNLWCGACGSTWPTERMACPACGNSDQRTLGYLKIEGDDARRIDTCDACGGYLKTVDLRARGGTWNPARADLELWRSADLDLVAAREGFVPMGRARLRTA